MHKLAKFSSNPGKVYFEGFVHLLRYIKENNTLVLKYGANMNDAPVFDLLRQASIKTESHLVDFSDSSWQDFPDTGRSTGAYIIVYQGGTIDHVTHVPGPVAQSSAESEYNAACTTVMVLAHFRMLIHELMDKDPDIVPEEYPFIVLDSKSDVCMDNNGKDNKHTRYITRIMHFIRNGENCEMHKIDWCEGGLKLAGIYTKNVGEHDLTTRMKYIMVILDN